VKQLREERGEQVRPEATQHTIPFWSDSFDYQGLEYKYKMVGTDPEKGSKTTVIPTVIIPLRFVFPDGQVFDAGTDIVDGQTPVHGILNSPIFRNYNFELGGTNVGNTQYGDAFQRANFWNSVSTRARNYHVLLGQPAVLPTQTIVVPDGLGWIDTDNFTGGPLPVVNYNFLATQEKSLRTALQISPRSLPITVRGLVAIESSHEPGQPGAVAWHGAETANGGVQTFIATSYGYGFSDVYPLSHEIAEWMDDPFADNFSPGWNYPFLDPISRCDSGFVRDLLEVGDPVEIFQEAEVPLPGGSYTYHVTEAMFIDFFTRRAHSRSVNGQYSMFEIGAPFGLPTTPSTSCTGHLELDITKVEEINYPGATATHPFGINNRSEVTGYYRDADGNFHGFTHDRSGYTRLDYPGASATVANKINDAGIVVGYFIGSDGFPHGFMYKNRRWTRLDYPGSVDTIVYGINSSGDLVGAYDNTQPVIHGFVLRNGMFEAIDTPFATQSAVTAINDIGKMAGYTWIDPEAGPYLGFLKRGSTFHQIGFPDAHNTFPYSINGDGDLAGLFQDPDSPFTSGFITFNGNPHELFPFIFGNNDKGEVVGEGYLLDQGVYRLVTFAGRLPLANRGGNNDN
jgi:uncharacterized membrane protein